MHQIPWVGIRAVDPDPHGSAFILPPGSGSAFRKIAGSGSAKYECGLGWSVKIFFDRTEQVN